MVTAFVSFFVCLFFAALVFFLLFVCLFVRLLVSLFAVLVFFVCLSCLSSVASVGGTLTGGLDYICYQQLFVGLLFVYYFACLFLCCIVFRSARTS